MNQLTQEDFDTFITVNFELTRLAKEYPDITIQEVADKASKYFNKEGLEEGFAIRTPKPKTPSYKVGCPKADCPKPSI